MSSKPKTPSEGRTQPTLASMDSGKLQTELGNLSEICVVTSDCKATIQGYAAMGIGPFTIYDFTEETVRDREWYGKAGDFTLKVAFATVGNITWEIIQPTGGSSLMADYLKRSGNRQGIQHIAFDMKNIPMKERQMMMAAKGIEPAMQGYWIGRRGTCHFCFFDTENASGTVFETIEFSDDWEFPDGEEYLPKDPGESVSNTEEPC